MVWLVTKSLPLQRHKRRPSPSPQKAQIRRTIVTTPDEFYIQLGRDLGIPMGE